MIGALWSIGGAIAFSLGHVALAKGIPPLGVVRATTVLLVSAAVATAVAALAIDGPTVLTAAPLAAIAWFAGAGLIHYGGWGFMNASIQRVGPSRFSAISGVTPLFGAVLAVAILHESVNPVMGLGIVLIVVGTYFIAAS
ncbi:MAG TPA: DMT family transporter [Actinomycetota bacterium]|jgi:drug/metabolite transporter (DMT)-like permease